MVIILSRPTTTLLNARTLLSSDAFYSLCPSCSQVQHIEHGLVKVQLPGCALSEVQVNVKICNCFCDFCLNNVDVCVCVRWRVFIMCIFITYMQPVCMVFYVLIC